MNYSIMHVINGEDHELNVVKRVSVGMMEAIVNMVAESCFVDGEYKPTRFDYFFWVGVIASYTDLDIMQCSDEVRNDLLDDVRFTDKLRGVISPTQLENIENSARELIRAKLDEHPFKSVAKKANEILDKIKGFVTDICDDEDVKAELKNVITKENVETLLQFLAMSANKNK